MGVEDIILSPEAISRAISMIKREEYLRKHKYDIYKGRNGDWYTYLPDDTKKYKRRQIRRRRKEDLENAVADFYESYADGLTIREVFEEWNDRRIHLNKIKEATATRYEQDFERYFGDVQHHKIGTITPDEVSDFLEMQVNKFNLTAKSFSNLKSLSRGILKRAKKRKLISFDVEPIFSDLDISDKEFKKRIVNDSKEIFYDDEIELLIQYCKEHRCDLSTLAIALIFVSGIRVGEVVCLKKTDILDREVYIHRTETQFKRDGANHFEVSDYPKTPTSIRRVIIPDSYKWVLDDLIERGGDEWIFTGIHGKRMHTSQIRKRLYGICRALDIPVRPPHKLRKTYGTILLDNNVGSKLIEKQMGHTDVMTTEIHYHRDRKRAQQKRDIINSIAEFS